MSEADFTGRQFGAFKIQRKLGAGGMAVVYQAHDSSLNRMVALKVIHEHLSKEAEFVARFHREARAAAQLSHPHIVQIYSVGEENGIPYFAMEYVKGTSLQGLIQSDGFLTAPRVATILAQACEALSAAHEAGIVHRDIKPNNIMLDSAGRVKVADFGIAHMATETRLTQTGMMLGTPGYTSPEQCFGAPLDARSDIYALGVTAYEMLTGRMPFEADTIGSLIRQIIEGSAPPLAAVNPTVPPALRDIVEKMMHKNPDDRYQSADDVLAALTRSDIDTRPVTQPTTRASAPVAEPSAAAAVAARGGEPRVDEPTRVNPTHAPSPPAAVASAASPAGKSRISSAVIVPLGIAAAAAVVFFALRPLLTDDAASIGESQSSIEEQAGAARQEQQTAGNSVPVADAETPAGTDLAVPRSDERAGAGAADSPEAPVEAASTTSPAVAVVTGAVVVDASDAAAGAGRTIPTVVDSSPPEESPAGGETPAPSAAPTVDAGEAPPRDAQVQAESSARDEAPDRVAPARAPAPSPRTVIASATGDYENVDLVGAQVEAALARGGFEILDLIPRGRDVREVARFEIVSTVKLVGTRELSFANRRMTQYTVAVTTQATDLVSGTRAAGPFTTTVEYTSINLQEQFQTKVDALAADLIKGLEARLGAAR